MAVVLKVSCKILCPDFTLSTSHFEGFFTSNASLSSSNSPAPDNNRMVSVQFYNEFAPRERIDPSPTTRFRYKRVSGADNEENTREVTR
ncbi:hypothetical protein F2Q68_00018592 [Brassica cretica]|uniref:Uncharacterized protein n=1 Tax=Brassica cretica TaxID=69181 RepID=A0A8S9FPD9_BRACR|nr:hypothetical protein F2Q68_00018592 [Brassica cretica]